MASSGSTKASAKFQKYFELSQPLTESKQETASNNIGSVPTRIQENKDAMDLKIVVNSFENERISQLQRPSFNLLPNKPKPIDRSRNQVKTLSFISD
jgi:hypothetical protein